MCSNRYEKDKNYYLEQFQKCENITYLSDVQTNSFVSKRKTFTIDTKKSRLIYSYVEQTHISPFVLFITVLSTYISRIKMNTEKFFIGTVVLNRAGIREKNTIGMFINTIPLLIELDNSQNFSENLSHIQDVIFTAFRHQKYNYSDVLADIRKNYNFNEKLYDVMLSYQNASISTSNKSESVWYHNGLQNESLQIHIDDRDNDGFFKIQYDYQIEKFTEYEINELHQHICNLLFEAIANDSKKLYEINMLTNDERQKLLHDFNDTTVDYPKEKCIHTLFEEQVHLSL